jgi:WD40 repeat protein
VAAAQIDGVVRLLVARDGGLVAVLDDHRGRVGLLAWQSDGPGAPTLLTGSWDGTVLLWGLGSLSTPAAGLAVAWPLDEAAASAWVLRR